MPNVTLPNVPVPTAYLAFATGKTTNAIRLAIRRGNLKAHKIGGTVMVEPMEAGRLIREASGKRYAAKEAV